MTLIICSSKVSQHLNSHNLKGQQQELKLKQPTYSYPNPFLFFGCATKVDCSRYRINPSSPGHSGQSRGGIFRKSSINSQVSSKPLNLSLEIRVKLIGKEAGLSQTIQKASGKNLSKLLDGINPSPIAEPIPRQLRTICLLEGQTQQQTSSLSGISLDRSK